METADFSAFSKLCAILVAPIATEGREGAWHTPTRCQGNHSCYTSLLDSFDILVAASK